MSNWFSHLVDYFTSEPPEAKNDLQEHFDNRPVKAVPNLAYDKPFKTSRIKQPLEILKQFVPIRNLDDAAIELLQQRSYCYRAANRHQAGPDRQQPSLLSNFAGNQLPGSGYASWLKRHTSASDGHRA